MHSTTIRRAGPADAASIEALFKTVYHSGSHPFQSLEDVSRFLEDSRNVQVVAEHRRRIVASMAMTYNPWNDSYELGRAITHPDYRSQGLAALLMQPAVDLVARYGLGGVYFGFPRVKRILDLCATLTPPMIAVGHDAGRHVANGLRETHAIVYGIPPHADFRHIAPTTASEGADCFATRVCSTLGLTRSRGAYPLECFVGDARQGTTAFEDLLIIDDRAAPNGAVEIVADTFNRREAFDPGRQVQRLIAAGNGLEHLTLTVLADKVDLIDELTRYGLRVTGYLPAWYLSGRCRYDCLQMSWHAFSERPRTGGLEDTLSSIDSELPTLTRIAQRAVA